MVRCLGHGDTQAFHILNGFTAVISIATSLYLLPLVPSLLSQLDESLNKLVQLNQETEDSRRKLFTFMAFLCHEIRNPLFAITSSATSLEDTELTEEQAIAVGSIIDSSDLMLRLVNDVLDLSKIDAGKLMLEEKVFDFDRLLDNLAHNIESQASNHRKGVKFEILREADVPSALVGDPIRLLQIIYNLLSNALKFTDNGSITLRVRLCNPKKAHELGFDDTSCATGNNEETQDTSTSQNSEYENDAFSMALLSAENGTAVAKTNNHHVVLWISVEDTGVGIEPDRLITIFEPYSQSKLSDYRRHGGTGLGLSIISGLTKAMKGKLAATSVVGEGSTFTLYLPIRVASVSELADDEDWLQEHTAATPLEISSRRLPSFQSTKMAASVSSISENLRESPVLTSNGGIHPKDHQDDHSTHAAISEGFKSTNDAATESLSEEVGLPKLRDTLSLGAENGGSSGSVNLIMTENVETSTTDVSAPKPKSARPEKRKLPKLEVLPNEHLVLVVDDNQVNQKIISKMLSHFGVEHRIAGNGEEAVALMKNESRNCNPENQDLPQFGLIFMDLCMPIMDGYEATQALRRMGLQLPIVALTANALSQERDRAAKVGATDFQTKPILRPDLHRVCENFLLRQS